MIEVKNLVKDYGGRLAVDHLSFTVKDGEIIGFLGPNGAGKSTTMNMITGYLAATEGEVVINGKNILEEPEEARRLIGYLPELPPLYTEMTVREYLNFAAELKKLPKGEREQAISESMELAMLKDVQGRLIKNLSKGYRQRVGLAQAVLGMPPVIILDEPTVGLDPKQIIEIRDLIKSLGKKHTVILSSHILSEVSAVCDHIMIISHGRLVASDTPENLERQMAGSQAILLTVMGTADAVREAVAGISGISGAEEVNRLQEAPLPDAGAEETEQAAESPSEREAASALPPEKAKTQISSLRLSLSSGKQEDSPGLSDTSCPSGSLSRNTALPSGTAQADTIRVREEIFYALAKHNLPILSMQLERASLETVFLELTASEQTDGTVQEARKNRGRGESGAHRRAWLPVHSGRPQPVPETSDGQAQTPEQASQTGQESKETRPGDSSSLTQAEQEDNHGSNL